MNSDWRSLCTEENKLVPSTVHVYRVKKNLIRINMLPAEANIFGQYNDDMRMLQLRGDNYRRASELVNASITSE
jgi:hypothetical protein